MPRPFLLGDWVSCKLGLGFAVALLTLLVVGFSSSGVAAVAAESGSWGGAQGFSVFFHCFLGVYTTDTFSFFLVAFIYICLLTVYLFVDCGHVWKSEDISGEFSLCGF